MRDNEKNPPWDHIREQAEGEFYIAADRALKQLLSRLQAPN